MSGPERGALLDLFFPPEERSPGAPSAPGGGAPAPATGVERTRAEWVLQGCPTCDHHDPSRCACGGGHPCHWRAVGK
jgi:hypothetical protein